MPFARGRPASRLGERALDHLDRVARLELALDLDDADRQQARAALPHGAGRAGIDDERPARRLGVLQPQLEGAVAGLARREPRALAPAREDRLERPRRVARYRSPSRSPPPWPSQPPAPSSACPPSRTARSCGRPRAPRASPRSLTSESSRASGWIRGSAVKRPSMSVISTSRSAADEDRDLRGQEVVVAKGDLVGGGRVVLVDHGHHPPLEQPRERPAGIQVVAAGAHVEEGQQHLGARQRRAPAGARRRRGRACPVRPRSPPAARRRVTGRTGSPSVPFLGRSRRS